jgi:hypothetical protein
MTAEQLAALDRAATQGVLFRQKPCIEDDFGVPIIATDYPPDHTPTNGMVLWATMQPTEIDAADTKRAEANATFVVALWNAYRTGKLVLIDEAAEAKVAVLREALRACRNAVFIHSSDYARDVYVICETALEETDNG